MIQMVTIIVPVWTISLVSSLSYVGTQEPGNEANEQLE